MLPDVIPQYRASCRPWVHLRYLQVAVVLVPVGLSVVVLVDSVCVQFAFVSGIVLSPSEVTDSPFGVTYNTVQVGTPDHYNPHIPHPILRCAGSIPPYGQKGATAQKRGAKKVPL